MTLILLETTSPSQRIAFVGDTPVTSQTSLEWWIVSYSNIYSSITQSQGGTQDLWAGTLSATGVPTVTCER